MSLSPDAARDASSLEAALYGDLCEEWKRHGKHWEEYASEMLGTAFLLFCVVGAVAFLFGSRAFLPRLIPSSALRLLLVGLLLGGASGLVALTPPGRLSGAHLNPAMSLGFWVLGKMHGRDVIGYIAGQLLGGLFGALVGGLVFGRLATEVHTGALHPGRGVGWAGTRGGELAATFALSLAVFSFVSHKNLARWTPLMATALVGLLVCVDGNFSGAGMNSARWFGPAAVAALWPFGWIYTLGPLGGAVAAAGLRRSLSASGSVPHTGKLFHDPRYRSLFLGDRLPSKPPESARDAAGHEEGSP